MLALAALSSWALASPGAIDPGMAFRALQFMPFLLGGPGWAGFFALFLAGVTMGAKDFMPRWTLWSGYFLSFVPAFATLVLVTIGAAVCLPVARFLGFMWLIVVGVYIDRRSFPSAKRA